MQLFDRSLPALVKPFKTASQGNVLRPSNMEDTQQKIKIWSGLDSSLMTSGWNLLNSSQQLLSHALQIIFSISSLLLQ